MRQSRYTVASGFTNTQTINVKDDDKTTTNTFMEPMTVSMPTELTQDNLTGLLKKICQLEKEMEMSKAGIISHLCPNIDVKQKPSGLHKTSLELKHADCAQNEHNYFEEIFDSLDNLKKGHILFSEFQRLINLINPRIPHEKVLF